MTHHIRVDFCFLASHTSHFLCHCSTGTSYDTPPSSWRHHHHQTQLPDCRAHPIPVRRLEPKWRMACYSFSPRANFRAVPSGSDTDMTLERAPRCLQASHLKPCVRECGDVTLTRLVISGSQSSYGGLQKTAQSGRKFKKHLILLLNYSVWVWNLVPSWLSLEDRRKSSSSLMLWPSLQKKIKHFSVSYFKYYFFLLLYSFIYLYFV